MQNQERHRIREQYPPATAHRTPYIIPLHSVQCVLSARTGWKASRLAEMALAGFPVPEAYVVTDEALKAFCAHNDIALDARHGDHEDIADRIRNGEFPPAVREAIEYALDRLSAPTYAVRSSSVAEDGQDFSMAGQFETCLRVSKNDVPGMIKRCWASLFNPSVTAYSGKNATAVAKDMGVIVQTQIDSRYAGVLFSLDPLQKTTDSMVIEWVEGLGEKLVSGRVTPERIAARRSAPVFPAQISVQLRGALEQLCTLTRQAEQLFGQPVDIEWCCDDAGLHLVQARPITALARDSHVIWSNVNMTENFPHPLTPLAWSVVERFYTYYIRSALRLFGWTDAGLEQAKSIIGNLTGIHSGRIYYHLTNWYEMLHFFPIGPQLVRFLDNYIGQNVPLGFEPSTTNHWPHRRSGYFSTSLFWLRLCRIVITAQRRLDRFETKFYAQRQQWRHIACRDRTAEGLYETLSSLLRFVDAHWAPPAMADILVMIFPGALGLLSGKWTAENPETVMVRLLQGLGVTSTEPTAMIRSMAKKIKENEKTDAYLVKGEYNRLESALDDDLKAQFRDFLERFGGRCYHDCMLVYPTFEERHSLFWDLVQRSRLAPDKHPAYTRPAKSGDHEPYLQKLLKNLPLWKRLVYRAVVRYARRSVGLRERGRLFQSLLFGEIRAVSLVLGRKLSDSGFIKEAEDVFYLGLDDIEKLVYGKYQFPATIPSAIEKRKAAHRESMDQTLPETFYLKRGEYFKPTRHTPPDVNTGSELKGTGVSSGVAEGKARVIIDPAQGHALQPGDILVARATDPGWTPLFLTAGGLILEKGGLLSHGAIVAREFGIPAVVGVDRATELIGDDRAVFVDGGNGTIQLR